MSAGCANLLVIGVAVLCYCIGYHEGRRAWREVLEELRAERDAE